MLKSHLFTTHTESAGSAANRSISVTLKKLFTNVKFKNEF